MCSKCQVKEETVFHRFFDCESFSKRIWSTFFPETPNSRALYLFLLETEDFMNFRGKRILYYIHEAFKRNLLENQAWMHAVSQSIGLNVVWASDLVNMSPSGRGFVGSAVYCKTLT
ncbi:hypothetical protein ROZALSC1DRAFT_25135 [Rozella allomycis CSF55]|uniref:Uncharacterized protein n=1 Tax=Rozella allomycis (strain CSF55) TaxID=988480 RepID=A0A4P9YB85_ROZAC|nr:hypothetical protein ROZALSC1DRAFT_25135 [Rozella allomycis CSF55]